MARDVAGEGPSPTYWSVPGLPHDGFLADFLMESKSFVRTT